MNLDPDPAVSAALMLADADAEHDNLEKIGACLKLSGHLLVDETAQDGAIRILAAQCRKLSARETVDREHCIGLFEFDQGTITIATRKSRGTVELRGSGELSVERHSPASVTITLDQVTGGIDNP